MAKGEAGGDRATIQIETTTKGWLATYWVECLSCGEEYEVVAGDRDPRCPSCRGLDYREIETEEEEEEDNDEAANEGDRGEAA
jgi:hypothetical protein